MPAGDGDGHAQIGVVAVKLSVSRRCCFLQFWVPLGRRSAGHPMMKAAIRVTFWGALAMGVTAGIGMAFGTQV